MSTNTNSPVKEGKVKGKGTVENINGKDYRVVITRFRNQEDLDKFGEKLGFEVGTLTNLTTQVILPEMEVKNKKAGKKRGHDESWREAWKGQPHFINEENEAHAVIKFFYDEEKYGVEGIAEVMEQSVNIKTKSLWMPKWDGVGREANLRVVGGSSETRYPVYVISKNRPKMCKTSEFLSRMEVKHYVVVEEWQLGEYEETVGKSPFVTLLTIPQRVFDEYETHYDFEKYGEERKTGPGAARNWCWEHSMMNGFKAHHVLDDNENGGFLLADNIKWKLRTGAWIAAMEDHFDAHTNVKIAGPCYGKFATQNSYHKSHSYNTRIYSWLLIDNSLWNEGIKWAGLYNEDTHICLMALKKGYATLQWNFYLQDKVTTQTMRGGNSEEFYDKEGTAKKSQMLADLHPDVAKVVWKFSRVHHEVDYSPFAKNDPGFDPSLLPHGEGTYDYGMYAVKIKPEEDFKVNNSTDCKTYIEANYPRSEAVYLFDGTRHQNGWDIFEDFAIKGY